MESDLGDTTTEEIVERERETVEPGLFTVLDVNLRHVAESGIRGGSLDVLVDVLLQVENGIAVRQILNPGIAEACNMEVAFDGVVDGSRFFVIGRCCASHREVEARSNADFVVAGR